MGLRLFIVEDHQDIADALSELLAAEGLCETVGKARTESDALAWSFHHEAGFDVAIVDLLLADGSGFSVLAHLVKYQPGKVVVFSDFVTPVIAERCQRLGAAAAFQKSRMEDCIAYVRALAS
jgi:DNA-binding NarL/FixJ family response regulator